METYYLITNVSGMKYWSYLGTKHNTSGQHAQMVKKHGDIYINARGGWMPKDCAETIHETCKSKTFPQSN